MGITKVELAKRIKIPTSALQKYTGGGMFPKNKEKLEHIFSAINEPIPKELMVGFLRY